MKQILLLLITFYQDYLSLLLRLVLGPGSNCRYSVSCSAYAKQVITTHGVKQGVVLAMKRFLSCQPLARKQYGAI